jgi:nucleoside-diphosphate-sugar epimerase
MNLFVLGATGAIGKHLLDIGLERGHRVTSYVRSPRKIHRAHERSSANLRTNRSPNRRPKNRYRRSAMENGRSKERRPWQRSMSLKNQCAAGRKRMQLSETEALLWVTDG